MDLNIVEIFKEKGHFGGWGLACLSNSRGLEQRIDKRCYCRTFHQDNQSPKKSEENNDGCEPPLLADFKEIPEFE